MAKKDRTFLDTILEDFGDKILDNHNRKIEAISTGCLSLDTSIGIGGIPKGMITMIYGPEGSGKTTIALNTAKVLAERGGKTLYVEVENLLNKELLKAVLGEDAKTENIEIVTPDSAETAFTIVEAGIQSGEFELIVIDSIGSMVSKRELENNFEDETMAVLPRVVAKFIKRNIYHIRTKNVAVLAINQVRDKIGTFSRVKTYGIPGGHQLQHESAVIISLTKGEHLMRGKEVVGIVTKFVVKKNKLSSPFRSFTIPIIFGQGIDFLSDLLDFAKLLGVIKGAGAYYKFEDATLGMGKVATREYLLNNPETLDKIVQTCYNLVNKESTLSELLNDLEDELTDEVKEV